MGLRTNRSLLETTTRLLHATVALSDLLDSPSAQVSRYEGGMMVRRAPYLMVASMDVDPKREDLFNEVYDKEHVPNLIRVPGVLSVVRYKRVELTMSIAGEVRVMPSSQPKYHAIYELERPDALVSDSWADAVEVGRWPTEIRPFTRNRQHTLLKIHGE